MAFLCVSQDDTLDAGDAPLNFPKQKCNTKTQSNGSNKSRTIFCFVVLAMRFFNDIETERLQNDTNIMPWEKNRRTKGRRWKEQN